MSELNFKGAMKHADIIMELWKPNTFAVQVNAYVRSYRVNAKFLYTAGAISRRDYIGAYHTLTSSGDASVAKFCIPVDDPEQMSHPDPDNAQVYSEELDFQLSTMMSKNELFDFYLRSILYSRGFRGAVARGIHYRTWSTLVKHLQELLDRTNERHS